MDWFLHDNNLRHERVNHRFLTVLNASSEAALRKCSYKKVFWKYTANLRENTHAEV